MTLALRVEYSGAFYHVINRGNVSDDISKNLIFTKPHLSQHGNRAWLVSFQQLSGFYRTGQGAKMA